MMIQRQILIRFIIIIITCIGIVQNKRGNVKITQKFGGIGPKGMDYSDTTTCDEFSRNARFNPYSILNDKFFTFYYWTTYTTKMIVTFFVPTQKEREYIQHILGDQVKDPINWTAPHFVMKDVTDNTAFLLTERNDRGMYWLYNYVILPDGEKMEATDVRFKQTSDNLYLAFMSCETMDVFIMSRLKDVPKKKYIQEVVSRFGYRSRKGRSYLYQGHEWMPMPEMDEEEYWAPKKPYVFNFK